MNSRILHFALLIPLFVIGSAAQAASNLKISNTEIQEFRTTMAAEMAEGCRKDPTLKAFDESVLSSVCGCYGNQFNVLNTDGDIAEYVAVNDEHSEYGKKIVAKLSQTILTAAFKCRASLPKDKMVNPLNEKKKMATRVTVPGGFNAMLGGEVHIPKRLLSKYSAEEKAEVSLSGVILRNETEDLFCVANTMELTAEAREMHPSNYAHMMLSSLVKGVYRNMSLNIGKPTNKKSYELPAFTVLAVSDVMNGEGAMVPRYSFASIAIDEFNGSTLQTVCISDTKTTLKGKKLDAVMSDMLAIRSGLSFYR